MDAILQKIKADITSRPLISGLIVLTIVAASTLLTLALVTLMNISGPYDQSFQELNGAHLWLHFDRDKVRRRDISRIEELPEVVASTGLQYSVESRVRLGDSRVWVSLRAMPAEPPVVNRLLLHEGRYLDAKEQAVLANEELNYYYQLAVDDPVGIIREDGKEVDLPNIGLAYNPMWDIYRNNQPSYLYLTEATLRELFPTEADWNWSMGLRLADPEGVDDLLAVIETKFRPDIIDSHTDWRDVRTAAMFEGQLNFVFLSAFSFFAILATVLVVASSISSIVLSQFKQIGMLKAIGFTQQQILILYMGQYLILSLVGSLGGLFVGLALAPIPLQSVAVSLDTTFQPSLDTVLVVLVFSIIPGIVILATLSAAYRGAKANIIKAIAVGAEAPPQKPAWGVRLATRWGAPIIFILGLNDIFARPLRSFMTGLNLTLGVVGIVFGLALNATIESYTADPSLLGIPYDALVTRDETSDGRTQHLLQLAPGVAAFYGEQLVDVEAAAGQSFQIRAVEGDLAAFPRQIAQGRFFRPRTNEAVAGRGLLDWLGLAVGDELALILNEERHRPVTFRIVGEYSEASNAGQMLMANLSTVEQALGHTNPESYYLKFGERTNVRALKQYLEPRPGADLNLTVIKQAIPDSVLYLQVAIFALAAILIGIAMINVFNTSLLAVQEKLRMIGTLKTVGMTPGQVVKMINTTAGLLGLLATLVGIPLGWIFAKGMLATLSQSYGLGGVSVRLNLVAVLLLVPLMVGVSILGSFIPARQAAKVSIVRVLRNE